MSDGVKGLSRRIRVDQGVSGGVEGVRHGWVCEVVEVLLDGARWLGHDAADGWTRFLLICSRGFLR